MIDVLDAHERILPLPALVWAAPGKDRGYNPATLLGLLRRRSKYQPEDFAPLRLNMEIDLVAQKTIWLELMEEIQAYIDVPPSDELGCLYFSVSMQRFGRYDELGDPQPHYPKPGGVIPIVGSQ